MPDGPNRPAGVVPVGRVTDDEEDVHVSPPFEYVHVPPLGIDPKPVGWRAAGGASALFHIVTVGPEACGGPKVWNTKM